jgi:hypothetical protein
MDKTFHILIREVNDKNIYIKNKKLTTLKEVSKPIKRDICININFL